jgi:alkaline phosphatase D
MARNAPDLYIACGDTVYADVPIRAAVETAEDGPWHNLVTEATAKPAVTLKDVLDRAPIP